jgi:hypothetical protein
MWLFAGARFQVGLPIFDKGHGAIGHRHLPIGVTRTGVFQGADDLLAKSRVNQSSLSWPYLELDTNKFPPARRHFLCANHRLAQNNSAELLPHSLGDGVHGLDGLRRFDFLWNLDVRVGLHSALRKTAGITNRALGDEHHLIV